MLAELPEERPGLLLGMRAIEMASPQPVPAAAVCHQARRLHVVNDHHVGLEPKLLGRHAIHLEVVLEPLVGEGTLATLHGHLECLGSRDSRRGHHP